MARQDINLDPQCWGIETEVWGTLGNHKHIHHQEENKVLPIVSPFQTTDGDPRQMELWTVQIMSEVSVLASRGDSPVVCLLSWVLREDMGLSEPQLLHLWHSWTITKTAALYVLEPPCYFRPRRSHLHGIALWDLHRDPGNPMQTLMGAQRMLILTVAKPSFCPVCPYWVLALSKASGDLLLSFRFSGW